MRSRTRNRASAILVAGLMLYVLVLAAVLDFVADVRMLLWDPDSASGPLVEATRRVLAWILDGD